MKLHSDTSVLTSIFLLLLLMDSILSIRIEKPLMLKDYLLEDLSSCSSNGFKSISRTQCCAAVVFFPEFKQPPRKSPIKAAVVRCIKLKLHKFIVESSFWMGKPREKRIGRWKPNEQTMIEVSRPSDWRRNLPTANGDNHDIWSEYSDVNLSYCFNGESPPLAKFLEFSDNGKTAKYPGNVAVMIESTHHSICNACTDNAAPEQGGMENAETMVQCSHVKEELCEENDLPSRQHGVIARIRGAKNKLVAKIRRFKNLARIKPVKRCSRRIDSDKVVESEDENKVAIELLRKGKTNSTRSSMWLKLKKKSYVLDMENEWQWRKWDEEKLGVALEIEDQLLTSLVNEFLVEITCE